MSIYELTLPILYLESEKLSSGWCILKNYRPSAGIKHGRSFIKINDAFMK